MSTVKADIGTWLNTAKLLQQQSALKRYVEINKMADEVATFLQGLHAGMRHMGSVGKVMTGMVDIGQLLGRLATFPALLAISKCYKALVSCLLFFCTERPHTSLECKAKQWALTLIRSTMCYDQSEEITATIECTGFTQQRISDMCLRQVCRDLQHSPALGDLHADNMRDVAAVCITSSHEVFGPVLAGLLDAWPDDQLMMSLGTGNSGELSYSVECLLWERHLSSLESSVLSLVTEASKRSRNTAELHKLLTSTNLPRACAENLSIYKAVYGMLKAVYCDSNGADVIARLIACLHECATTIRHSSSDQRGFTSFSAAFPLSVRSLVCVLEVSIKGMDKCCCEYYTQALSGLLCDMTTGLLELHYLLMAFPHWYHVALVLSLTSDKLSVETCLVIIEAYMAHSMESHSITHTTATHSDALNRSQADQVSLAETISSLRRLLGKLSLTQADLHYALSASRFAGKTPICVDHLVMWFLLLSVSGHLISDTVLQSETHSQCVSCHLRHILPLCELISDGPLSRLCLSTSVQSTSTIVSRLLQQDNFSENSEGCLCENGQDFRQWATEVNVALIHQK